MKNVIFHNSLRAFTNFPEIKFPKKIPFTSSLKPNTIFRLRHLAYHLARPLIMLMVFVDTFVKCFQMQSKQDPGKMQSIITINQWSDFKTCVYFYLYLFKTTENYKSFLISRPLDMHIMSIISLILKNSVQFIDIYCLSEYFILTK